MRLLPDQTDPAHIWNILQGYTGHLAFDIGGNAGQAALVLANHFDHVISVEPCSEALAVLIGRVPRNVTPVGVAISDHDGIITLDETENSIRTGQLTSGTGLNWGPVVGHRECTSLTLDSLGRMFGWPDMVKIDTEGHELEIVLGGHHVWGCHPAVLIEVHAARNEEPIRDLMPGYQLRKIDHDGYGGSPLAGEHFWLESAA